MSLSLALSPTNVANVNEPQEKSENIWAFINTHRHLMEQHTLKNVKNCLITNIYAYLESSGGQSSNPHLNVVHFFNTRVD
jgi:hypothetical protein